MPNTKTYPKGKPYKAVDNQIEPKGGVCPKCGGRYIWMDEDGRCLNCGYVYNKIVIVHARARVCQFGKCRDLVCGQSLSYCGVHLEIKRQRKGVKPDNLKKLKSKEWFEHKTRYNFPLSMRKVGV